MKKTETAKNAAAGIKPQRISKRGCIERTQMNTFWIIMTPFILFLLIMKGYPLIWGLYISLTNYTGFNLSDLKFVGLNNFKRVFADNEALPSILRVLGIGVITVPTRLVICIVFSLLLSNTLKGVGVFRTLFYLPSVVPAVAIAMMWKIIYAYDGGLFNMFREMMGLEVVNWLGFEYVKTALIIMMLWTAGGGILTNIAAIKGIPDDLYEAADIEGAGVLTKTFKITIPMISNMLYMSVVTSIIGTFQLFGQPVMLAGVGSEGLTAVPIRPIYTYLVHVYQQVFVNMRFGYGMALVWVIFVVIMAVTFILEKSKKHWVYTETD